MLHAAKETNAMSKMEGRTEINKNKMIDTVGSRSIQPPDVFLLIPKANKSCNIVRCVTNMLQIIQNMMVSQCSELELSTVVPATRDPLMRDRLVL